MDKEHLESQVHKHNALARKHFFLAVLAFWVASITGSIYLFHAEWVFNLLGQSRELRILVVPTLVLTLNYLGLIVLIKLNTLTIFNRK